MVSRYLAFRVGRKVSFTSSEIAVNMGKSGSLPVLDCTARVRQGILGTLVSLKALGVPQEPRWASANPLGLEMNSHTSNCQPVEGNSFRRW